jgi:hypothetical protein
MLKILVISIGVFVGSLASAANSPECTYNEKTGELIAAYEAPQRQGARGWVPLTLELCQDQQKQSYAILGYNAVGLGLLRDLPLPFLPAETAGATDQAAGQKVIKYVGSYDERDAYRLFDSSNLTEGVVLFGDSKTQILVYRREFERIVSNVLFLKEKSAVSPTAAPLNQSFSESIQARSACGPKFCQPGCRVCGIL